MTARIAAYHMNGRMTWAVKKSVSKSQRSKTSITEIGQKIAHLKQSHISQGLMS